MTGKNNAPAPCLYCGYPKNDPGYDYCSWECSEAHDQDEEEQMSDLNTDTGYSEWSYRRDQEDKMNLDSDYESGELSVREWNARYYDCGECSGGGLCQKHHCNEYIPF